MACIYLAVYGFCISCYMWLLYILLYVAFVYLAVCGLCIPCCVTRLTKHAFSCSKFLSPGGQLWANTAFEGSQFYSIGVPKFYSWVNVISVYVYNDLG